LGAGGLGNDLRLVFKCWVVRFLGL